MPIVRGLSVASLAALVVAGTATQPSAGAAVTAIKAAAGRSILRIPPGVHEGRREASPDGIPSAPHRRIDAVCATM